MSERYRTTMEDWYHYHGNKVKELEEKAKTEGLSLVEKTALNNHKFWVQDIESKILTQEDILNEK